MQGESQAHPKSALKFARRDRRAQLDARKGAEQVLEDTTNRASAEAGAKDSTHTVSNPNDAETAAGASSNQKNAAPVTEDQQHDVKSPQNKTKKKKGYWSNRRSLRKRKHSANPKGQENKVDCQADGAAEAKDNADDKGPVKENNPATPGSDTAVEDVVKGQGVVVGVKV